MRSLLCALIGLTLACGVVAQSVYEVPKRDEDASVNVTVMSWNILAPIWIDREASKAEGVDVNLLAREIRLKLVARKIMKQQPDILALQEVQEDVFSDLFQMIKAIYQPIAFAPNENDYWKSYLSEGVDHVKNGVATFYNRRKFNRMSHNLFSTGRNGSVALSSVFYPRLAQFRPRRYSGPGQPLIVINCHQETGFTVAASYDRVAQGMMIMQEANRIRADLNKTSPESQPSVIIAGDFNSQHPFPGFTSYKSNGYLDALETVGDPSKHTFFYAKPRPLPTGDAFVNGATLDHVFIQASDAADSRIQLLSATVPDINSDDLSEDSYVQKLKNMALLHVRKEKYEQSVKILTTIVAIRKDDKEYDTQVNRVLRAGSDHFPLLVKIKLTN